MNPRAAVPALALLSVVLAGALAGCSGADQGASSGASGGATSSDHAAAPVPAEVASRGVADSIGAKNRVEPDLVARAVIRKGSVELRSHDVGKAQLEVHTVADRYAGEVTDEKTSTNDDGKPSYTRMVLRIPTARFGDAMDDLKGVAELRAANASEQDVTTKLIDTRTRLAAQKRSIARITVLFDRAQSIRDIMAIEAELSRRQADLDSLERQAAYLKGQTSMSTIVVSIDQTPAKIAPAKDSTGFLAGLEAGWNALVAFAVALATGLGALLPWLVVLVVIGPPAYLVLRALRRRIRSSRNPGRTPSAA